MSEKDPERDARKGGATDEAAGDRPASAIDTDALKFFASAVGLGVAIIGYSYSHTFFRSFGISLFQLKLSWLDIIYRGIVLVEDPKVLAIVVLVMLVASAIFAYRAKLSPNHTAAVGALAVLLVVLAAVFGGRYQGYAHARSISVGGAGKKVFCKFVDSGSRDFAQFAAALDGLALQQRLRLVHYGSERIYIAPVLDEVPVGQKVGEAYAIPTSSVQYCRIVGS